MSHYRLVGIQCDWNDGACDEQIELTGGATFPAVWAEARKKWLAGRGWQLAAMPAAQETA